MLSTNDRAFFGGMPIRIDAHTRGARRTPSRFCRKCGPPRQRVPGTWSPYVIIGHLIHAEKPTDAAPDDHSGAWRQPSFAHAGADPRRIHTTDTSGPTSNLYRLAITRLICRVWPKSCAVHVATSCGQSRNRAGCIPFRSSCSAVRFIARRRATLSRRKSQIRQQRGERFPVTPRELGSRRRLKGTVGAMLQNDRQARHPVGFLCMDQMADDDVRAPCTGTLCRGGPPLPADAKEYVDAAGVRVNTDRHSSKKGAIMYSA